jgi:hypothetical protein
MFHPTGLVFAAEVKDVAEELPARALAERLAGPALVRFSSAWWKNREWPDVLGCAVRFTHLPLQAHAREGDQDLLFATIVRPWTMFFSPLTTKYRDFRANDYYAVSPFEVPGLGRVEWRLRPLATGESKRTDETTPARPEGTLVPASRPSRTTRLTHATATGHADWMLEYAPYRKPSRIHDSRSFRPLVRIALHEPIELDQQALRFDAFRAGRWIHPVGFIHGLRRATYAASRRQPAQREPRQLLAAFLSGAGAVVATLGVGIGLRHRG